MQHPGRCPRCGYVLRFNGLDYTCDFCGYPSTAGATTRTLHEWEKSLKTKAHAMVERMKRPPSRQGFMYYPVAVQPCAKCGLNLSVGTPRCPNCGAPQETPFTFPVSPETSSQTENVDKKVLDYIIAHDGTISLSQATHELALPPDALQLTIDRLKRRGFLNQP